MKVIVKDSLKMFNFPWAWREQTGFVSSKGPSFKWAPRYSFSLSGTQIKIKLPKNRYPVPDEVIEVESPPSYYDLQEGYGRSSWDDVSYPLFSKRLIHRLYEFYGDYFTGSMGHIELHSSVYTPQKKTEGLNFFNPRALEGFITGYLTNTYGDDRDQRWNGPFNWRPLNWSIPAVRFEVRPTYYTHGRYEYLVFPIDKHHVFLIACEETRIGIFTDITPEPHIDEWIDPKPFQTFIDQIYDSVQVTLSPEAEVQRQESVAGLEDASLVKDFPPLYWGKAVEKKKILLK